MMVMLNKRSHAKHFMIGRQWKLLCLMAGSDW